MRGLFTVLGVLTIVLGALLALQGAGLFPAQSTLNGDHKWIFYGGCLALGGVVLLSWSRAFGRRRGR